MTCSSTNKVLLQGEAPTQCNECHDEHLGPRAHQDWEQHASAGWPKHVAMDKLPPILLMSILPSINL